MLQVAQSFLIWDITLATMQTQQIFQHEICYATTTKAVATMQFEAHYYS